MQRANLTKLSIAALLAAISLILPYIFHSVAGGVAGGIFLPMHIPVLLGGLILGPVYGLSIGITAPVLNFFINGMPPAARLPFMIFELMAYGAAAGLFKNRIKSIYIRLIIAQIIGRIAYLLALIGAIAIFGAKIPLWATFSTAFVQGLPGIVIQLALIPALVVLYRETVGKER